VFGHHHDQVAIDGRDFTLQVHQFTLADFDVVAVRELVRYGIVLFRGVGWQLDVDAFRSLFKLLQFRQSGLNA